jgi:hypothetical protein
MVRAPGLFLGYTLAMGRASRPMQLERVFIMITKHEYTRKPSMATLRAALRRAMDQGSDSVQLTWGENEITVERTQYGWIGYGWIGRSGGDDLARSLNMR